MKKYKKGYFKEIREKNESFYEGKSSLNWGEMVNGKYSISNRYHFDWKAHDKNKSLVKLDVSLEEYIVDFVKKTEKETGRKVSVYIGVDSQNYLMNTMYVCVISLYVEGNGGHLVVSKLRMPKIYDFRYRLLTEADMLGEICRNIEPYLKENGIKIAGRHLDYNSSTEKKSNGVVTEASNYLKHLGYTIDIKPQSWAASHCADFFC